MLPATLGRYVGHGPLDDLQQGLLDALAADVPGDGGVLALPGDLVDLVHVDDALFRPLHVKIRRLDQPQEDVLHILAHVSGLGEGGGVGDGEGDVQDLRQGLGKQGLAGARGPDEQDVALLELHVAALPVVKALIVVVHRHGQGLFGGLLPDDVLVHILLDGLGRGDHLGEQLVGGVLIEAVLQDVVALLHAFVADIDPRPGDDPPDLLRPSAAEGAFHFLFVVSCQMRQLPSYGQDRARPLTADR